MDKQFQMTITLNVLNHLGINLYSNVPSVLSEIVANSWDADAENVYINFLHGEITILDDGVGMSEEDVNNKFLSVGHPKREEGNNTSPVHKRRYMGRKGIGKLSMFSIAKTIDVITKKDGMLSAFRMNVDDITVAISDESNCYYPQVIHDFDQNAISKENGTKIILKDLKKSISSATPEYIRKRISRRFSIIGAEYSFQVHVDNELVTVADRDYYHKLNYIWYYGQDGEKYASYAVKAEHKTPRKNLVDVDGKQYAVSGWIGTVENSGSLKDDDDNLNKIVILVRGKLGQENILDEYTEGGLYSKYIIGEIHADFFDDDDKEDMATSSRQEYKKDDDRFIALRKFILGELKHIQNEWTGFRNESGVAKAQELSPVIREWYKTLNGDDQEYAKKMFGKVNQIVFDDRKRSEILRYSILAFEKLRYNHKLSQIENLDSQSLETLGTVISGFDDIEATLYYQIIKERTEIIKVFNNLIDDNEKEKAIQQYLFDHLWLLDPSWERIDGTEYMEITVLNALGSVYDGLTTDEKKGRLDIGYRKTAGKHVVIELKRAKRVIKTSELIDQILKYEEALAKVLNNAGQEKVYEFIVVLGMPVDNDSSLEKREKVAKTLGSV